RRLRVRLSADYERLDFLRVLRSHPAEQIHDAGPLIAPPQSELQGPLPVPPKAGTAGAGNG
ncbi:MAG TPA: rod shape-determining protein MreC, partial [Paenirhodobacter sp.]